MCAARLLAAVGDVGRGSERPLPGGHDCGGLVFLVAAGAAHVPLLALGLFACLGLELLVAPEAQGTVAAAEPVELAEAHVSRAA